MPAPGGGGFQVIRVVKPVILRMIDLAFSKATAEDLQNVIDDLDNDRNIVDIARDHGAVIPGSLNETHLRTHWFNETGAGWWQHLQPLDRRIRPALELLCRRLLALDTRDVSSAWVANGDPNSGPFAISINEWARPVGLTFHTPAVPRGARDRGKIVTDRHIWLVQGNQRGKITPKHAKYRR